jgi:hypothetical protein
MSNIDRLEFIKSSEKRRQDRKNQLWLDLQQKTSDRLKQIKDEHLSILAARLRH